MGLGHWQKEHMSVTYKGVNITDEIGLCICEECTKKIRAHVDKELEPTSTSTSICENPVKNESEEIPDISTDLKKLHKCYAEYIPPSSKIARIDQIIAARKNFLTKHGGKLVTAKEYHNYLKNIDNISTISDNPEAALLGVVIIKKENKESEWYIVQFEEYKDFLNT